MSKAKQITKFAIAGEVTDFVFKGSKKIKYVQLKTYRGDISVKVAKEMRLAFSKVLSIGDKVLVEGEKYLSQTGKIKFKALSVNVKQLETETDRQPTAPQPKKSTILVCQKSDCQKRGSQNICRLLEETLRDRGLDDRIAIKKVGCIKQCKSGPHVVLMPNRTRYSQVKPNSITELIEQNFPAARYSESA